MKAHEADRLINTIKSLVDEKASATPMKTGAVSTPRFAGGETFDFEEIYQRIKKRLLDELPLDPILVHLISQQPELIVEYERRVERVDSSTLRGRICKLIAQGFFKDARATSAVRRELGRTGPDPGGGGTLSAQLADLLRVGFLVREGESWGQAPGIKVREDQKELEVMV